MMDDKIINLPLMVAKTKTRGHKFCAVDQNGDAWSYNSEPFLNETKGIWSAGSSHSKYLGWFDLACNWKKTLIDVNDITL